MVRDHHGSRSLGIRVCLFPQRERREGDMGVTSDVHRWWEESQMRVLVLSSLVVQFLLSFSTLLRRHGMRGWFRFMMSLAFLGSDALVIYALATLFDRHKADGGGRRGGSSTLEVVWAPVLLADCTTSPHGTSKTTRSGVSICSPRSIRLRWPSTCSANHGHLAATRIC